jgi:hypothetical protein
MPLNWNFSSSDRSKNREAGQTGADGGLSAFGKKTLEAEMA